MSIDPIDELREEVLELLTMLEKYNDHIDTTYDFRERLEEIYDLILEDDSEANVDMLVDLTTEIQVFTQYVMDYEDQKLKQT